MANVNKEEIIKLFIVDSFILSPDLKRYMMDKHKWTEVEYVDYWRIYREFVDNVDKANLTEAKYTEEDMKQFGLFLGSNLKAHKNKMIDELLKEFTRPIES